MCESDCRMGTSIFLRQINLVPLISFDTTIVTKLGVRTAFACNSGNNVDLDFQSSAFASLEEEKEGLLFGRKWDIDILYLL